MYIVFNGLRSGCGNNGGTRTIFKSAEALRKLGYKCDVLATVDNFTWFEHKKPINYIPEEADVIINIAAVDYTITKNCNIKKKYAWWRLKESYSMSEASLNNCFKDTTVINLVNSKGLQQEFLKIGVESSVVYQGLDFNIWEDKELRSDIKVRIGCLYSSKTRKRWKDFKKLSSILGTKNYEYVGFGTEKNTDTFLCSYLFTPSHNALVDLYSSCDFWFAPTEDEGLHNPPMEAALCGAKVVCSDCKSNGMVLDYASNDTALIYPEYDINEAAYLINTYKYSSKTDVVKCMKSKLQEVIGSRVYNMKKLLTILGD